MSEWKLAALGDFINVKHGYAFKSDGITSEESPEVLVTPGNFYIGGGFKSGKFKFFKGNFPQSYVLKESDIVVTMTDLSKEGDTLGYGAKIPKSNGKVFLHNQRIGLVEFIREDICKDFLYWILRTSGYQGFVLGAATGTSIRHTSPTTIKEYKFLHPTFNEQKAIAAVLSSFDDKIDLLHRQNQTLEAMAATLFRQWFVEEAQEDWKEVAVGDYVELNRASIDKNYSYKTIEYLDTGSLTEGKIESLQSLTLDEAPSRAKRLVQHNDVLISTVRPDQKHYGIIKNPIENLVVSTGFCVLTCTKIDPHFIYLLLTNDEMTDYLHTIAEGSTSTYPSLKPSDIGAIIFQLPPDDKLKKFSIIAHNSWEKIEKNHIQIRTLEKLRDNLLPKLMSGEVRVRYPDLDAALALLSRKDGPPPQAGDKVL